MNFSSPEALGEPWHASPKLDWFLHLELLIVSAAHPKDGETFLVWVHTVLI